MLHFPSLHIFLFILRKDFLNVFSRFLQFLSSFLSSHQRKILSFFHYIYKAITMCKPVISVYNHVGLETISMTYEKPVVPLGLCILLVSVFSRLKQSLKITLSSSLISPFILNYSHKYINRL